MFHSETLLDLPMQFSNDSRSRSVKRCFWAMVEEVKLKDIALILDIPLQTVTSGISRARRVLRRLLQPQVGESQ